MAWRLDCLKQAALHATGETFDHVGDGSERIAAVRVGNAENPALMVLAAYVLSRYPMKDEAVKFVKEENLLTG